MGMFTPSSRKRYYVSYGPPRTKYVRVHEPDVCYAPVPQGRVATTIRQTCASCGKFRSAKWEAAHPLMPGMGASSGICARCQRDKTSSEERFPRRRHKRSHRHHHSRHCTDATDDSYCSINDRRSPRRYRSDSRDYSRPKASSRDNIRIVIANQPGERKARVSTRSTSTDDVQVLRRTSIVEVPQRVRSTSRARSSSRARYLDDGTAQYVEDLVCPRYRSRPRSLSRSSYVEEVIPAKSRRRRRSSTSHVQFVDDFEEPVIVERPPRRISRRRAVYFDGAASLDVVEDEDQGRSYSPPHNRVEGRRSSSGGVHHIDEVHISYDNNTEPAQKAFIEDRPFSRDSARSSATQDAHQSMPSHDEPSKNHAEVRYHHSYDSPPYDSDGGHEKIPRPGFRAISSDQTPKSILISNNHKRAHSVSEATEPHHEQFITRSNNSIEEHAIHERRKPPNKKRRRYRDDSSEDEYPTITYRHVPARTSSAPTSPAPSNQPDYLTEMLQSSHITPPNQQSHWHYNRGPPSPPTSRSSSGSAESTYGAPHYDNTYTEQHYPDPSFYRQNVPKTDLYGNPISSYGIHSTHDQYDACQSHDDGRPFTKEELEYDWMT